MTRAFQWNPTAPVEANGPKPGWEPSWSNRAEPYRLDSSRSFYAVWTYWTWLRVHACEDLQQKFLSRGSSSRSLCFWTGNSAFEKSIFPSEVSFWSPIHFSIFYCSHCGLLGFSLLAISLFHNGAKAHSSPAIAVQALPRTSTRCKFLKRASLWSRFCF